MSSRNRRNRGEQNDNPFGTTIPSAEEVDKIGYGDPERDSGPMAGPLGQALGRGMTVKYIPLDQIIPDPRQPRHVIPFKVQQRWNNTMGMAELFQIWEAMIHEENDNTSFSIASLIEQVEEVNQEADKTKILTTGEGEKVTRNEQPKPLEAALLKIIDLAASILREDLTNPITVAPHVAPNGVGYMIETGERRWLAFNLLYMLYGDQKWKKIPARTIDSGKPDVWRQATENNARDDLNAIGKARQLALLTMDLWEREEGSKRETYQPIEAFKVEQEFYQQGSKGHPYGKGELLLAAMGAKNMSTIKRYRDLLTLPNDIWQLADDTNCPESILREIISESDHEAQLRKFWEWYDKNFANGKNVEPPPPRSAPNYFMRFQESYYSLENTFKHLESEEFQDAIEMLENLLDSLKAQKRQKNEF